MIFLCTFLGILFDSPSSHERLNNQFSRSLSKNINSCWELSGGMDGGKLNPTLEIVSYTFRTKNDSCVTDKDSARKLFVDIVDYLLASYNSNQSLKDSYSNYPYLPKNIQIVLYLTPNEDELGQIDAIVSFRDKVIFYYVTNERVHGRETETFEEAYFKVYGREWDPFKYGDCQKSERP